MLNCSFNSVCFNLLRYKLSFHFLLGNSLFIFAHHILCQCVEKKIQLSPCANILFNISHTAPQEYLISTKLQNCNQHQVCVFSRPKPAIATQIKQIKPRLNKCSHKVYRTMFHFFCAAVYKYKKLSYRRGTARCVVSIEILPIATQQCRNYLYDKS